MDLRTRTKIRWIKFYSADLPHKSLSNKDLLIINGGLLDPSKIQHALLEKSDGFFCSLMFKNPSEILFCKIRRKIQHALLLENLAFFWFPYAQESVEKLALQTPSFLFPTSVENDAPNQSSAFTFFNEQRAAPIECSILATRCHFTLISAVQELSLADINNSKNTLSHSHIAHHGSQRTEAVASTNAQEL